MSLSNREIADIFARCADMLQIRGDNIHRVLSYRRAAETIRALPRDLRVISSEGGLTELKYIGKTIAAKIDEMLDTDELEFYNRLRAEIPEGLVDIMHINGVGPKKAKLFWQQLDITTVDALKIAADNDKLAALPGMGAKSQQKILDGIEALSRQSGRMSIGEALPAAQAILALLLDLPEASQGALAGSIRRGRETIGDVDILIASDNAAPIMQRFVEMENVARVLGHGPTKSSVELLSGLQVDVRVLEKARWGTAAELLYRQPGAQCKNTANCAGRRLQPQRTRAEPGRREQRHHRVRAQNPLRQRGKGLRRAGHAICAAGNPRRQRRD